MMLVVKVGNRLSQRLDPSSRSLPCISDPPGARHTHAATHVFTPRHGDIDSMRPLEAALDIILDLWRSLSQIGPRLRLVEIPMLVGALAGPHHARRGPGRIEPGTVPSNVSCSLFGTPRGVNSLRFVPLVGIAELAMDLRRQLWRRHISFSSPWQTTQIS